MKQMRVFDLFKLDGKNALVTGAGAGLGKAMAKALADAGANVAVVDLNQTTAQVTVSEIKELGRDSLAIQADVTQADQVTRMVEATVKAFGGIDIAVNNAGISAGAIPVENIPVEHWQNVIETNVNSVFLCAQAEGNVMIKQKKGKIINTASMSGFIINKGFPATLYCTAKGAIVLMTKGLAAEWAKYNINVNAIAPGYFKTDLTKKFFENPDFYQKMMIDLIPMGRIGEPQELAGTVVYLASEASNYVTGHILLIDGGYTIW